MEPPRARDDIKTVVAAIAVVLQETVSGFEDTVSRITDIAVMWPGRTDRDLVVALQDFDRLQQEFATLGDVLLRLSTLPDGSEAGEANPHDADHPVLASISIADLKERLSRRLRDSTANRSGSDASDEAVF